MPYIDTFLSNSRIPAANFIGPRGNLTLKIFNSNQVPETFCRKSRTIFCDSVFPKLYRAVGDCGLPLSLKDLTLGNFYLEKPNGCSNFNFPEKLVAPDSGRKLIGAPGVVACPNPPKTRPLGTFYFENAERVF